MINLLRDRETKRFGFGKNWLSFLATVNEEKIHRAEESLRDMLGLELLEGKSFLDIGCGSGLFSLAAMRLKADRVHSFDYDMNSVRCAIELKSRYLPQEAAWTIERGNALDEVYLSGIGTFDIVYSWGVLHHTGDMWRALENAAMPVHAGGRLFVAIYNDQGRKSRFWYHAKRGYCLLPDWSKFPYAVLFVPILFGPSVVLDLVRGRFPLNSSRASRSARGMSIWHDHLDWIGGYPFEVAKPHEIFDFYRSKGFRLDRLVTVGTRSGNNQYVFVRE